MSKTTLVTSFLFLVIIFSPTPSYAIFGNFLNLRSELKNDKIEAKIENKTEVKLERQENKEERQDQRLENKKSKAQVIIKRLRQGIVSRFENTQKHKTRIEARLAKGNYPEAKAKFATYSEVKYNSDLALFDAKTVEIYASASPLKLTPELKTLAKTLQADVKSLRQILADTLRLIIKNR